MSSNAVQTPIEVFCSYAHTDDQVFREVLSSLEPFVQQRLLTIWYDSRIGAGSEWIKDIDLHLNTAQIILLFVSPAFLASDYCMNKELPRALERTLRKEAVLIPILLEPLDLSRTSFGHLQALPLGGKPLSEWDDKAEGRIAIATNLKALTNSLRKSVPSSHANLLNLPFRRNPYFTGREDILEQLHRNLHQHHTSSLVQAMTGLGGIGKTQTAAEYAYRFQREYDTILWANANSQETLAADYERLARLLMVAERDEQEQSLVIQAVVRWMETHECWLLVLDNGEDLEAMNDFLPHVDHGHVLLTTRRQMVGERAAPVTFGTMDRETGALLLLRRAKLIAPSLTLYTSSLSLQVREEALVLAEELGGLPLALDQAGAYIEETGCGLAGYLHVYQTHSRSHLLAERGRFGKDHPASVMTTFSLSFERVEQADLASADMLRICAFFASDAIPEKMIVAGTQHLPPSLQKAVADPLQFDATIKVLLSYSLISRSEDAALTVHRLVQSVVQDAIPAKAKEQWIQRAVCTVGEAFNNKKLTQWSALERCLPHALRCLDWIEPERKPFPEAAVLYGHVGHFLKERAQYGEAESYFQRGLAHWQLLGIADNPLSAICLEGLGQVYKKLGQYDKADSFYKRALMINQQWIETDHPLTANILNDQAALHQSQGKYADAETLFRHTLSIRQKVFQDDSRERIAQSLNNLGNLCLDQGKYEQAEPLFQNALGLLGQWDKNSTETLSCRNGLARIYKQRSEYEQAETLYRRNLEACEQQQKPNLHIKAITFNNLGALYHSQEKYDEAISFYRCGLAIDEELFGSEHLEIATDKSNLAQSYAKQGKYEQAESLLQSALALKKQWLEANHPEIAKSLDVLASFYVEQGRYEQAESLFQDALNILEPQFDQNPHDLAQSLNNLAFLYQKQNKYVKAEPLYRRAYSIHEMLLGPQHQDTLLSLKNLAELYLSRRKYAEAELLYQRNLEQHYGSEDIYTADLLSRLIAIYAIQGKYTEVVPLYKGALAIYERVLGEDHSITRAIRETYARFLGESSV